jgi:hypothetical protein
MADRRPLYQETKAVDSEEEPRAVIKKDWTAFVTKARDFCNTVIAEKLWRMDMQNQIEGYIHRHNRELKETLNYQTSKKDIKLFVLRRKSYIEEDVFRYFYPFCLLNSVLLTAVIFRKNSWFAMGTACVCMAEYVYFLFAFPVEAFHFHKRAMSKHLPYA